MAEESQYDEERKPREPIFGDREPLEYSSEDEEDYGTKGGEVERELIEEVRAKRRRTPVTNEPTLGDNATNDRSLADNIWGN
jgi:hypothetical protein